jgi:hypothetical protein
MSQYITTDVPLNVKFLIEYNQILHKYFKLLEIYYFLKLSDYWIINKKNFVSHAGLSVSENYQSACTFLICPFLGAFVRFRKETVGFVTSVRPSVRPHATARLLLDRFLLKLTFEYFSKICLEYSSFVKIWQ